jgi:hypothetical protein
MAIAGLRRRASSGMPAVCVVVWEASGTLAVRARMGRAGSGVDVCRGAFDISVCLHTMMSRLVRGAVEVKAFGGWQ